MSSPQADVPSVCEGLISAVLSQRNKRELLHNVPTVASLFLRGSGFRAVCICQSGGPIACVLRHDRDEREPQRPGVPNAVLFSLSLKTLTKFLFSARNPSLAPHEGGLSADRVDGLGGRRRRPRRWPGFAIAPGGACDARCPGPVGSRRIRAPGTSPEPRPVRPLRGGQGAFGPESTAGRPLREGACRSRTPAESRVPCWTP